MSKFKVGDRVKDLDGHGNATVNAIRRNSVQVAWDNDRASFDPAVNCFWPESDFELIKQRAHPVGYISGAMTGKPDNGFPEFNRFSRLLTSLGITHINPASKGVMRNDDGSEWSWEQYLAYDLDAIVEGGCTVLYQLPGWQDSKGARLEYEFAKRRGMLIMEVAE